MPFFRHLNRRLAILCNALPFVAAAVLSFCYFGGNSWWVATAKVVFLALSALYAYCQWQPSHRISVGAPRFTPLYILFLLPIAFGLLQWFPFMAAEPLRAARAFFAELGFPDIPKTGSAAWDATFMRVEFIVTCMICFALCFFCARGEKGIRAVFVSITLAATGNAVFALFSSLRFNAMTDAMVSESLRGMFLNRNHFGFLMIMGMLSSIGLLVSLNKRERDKKSYYTQTLWKRIPWEVPLCLAITLEGSGLVLSLSRGAFLGTTLALLIFFCAYFKHLLKEKRMSRTVAVSLILTTLALMIALPVALEHLSDRFAELLEHDLSWDDRARIWALSLKMIRDYAWTGCGLAAYPTVIQQYAPAARYYVVHAHNDYLEFIAELGIPMAAICFLSIIACLAFAYRHIRNHHNSVYRWCGTAGFAGIVGCMLHEGFDFNLLAWSNALMMSVLVAGVALCATQTEKAQNESSATAVTAGNADALSMHSHHEHHHHHHPQGIWGSIRAYRWLIAVIFFAVMLIPAILNLYGEYAFYVLQSDMAQDIPAWQLRREDDLERLRLADISLRYGRRTRDTLRLKAKAQRIGAMHLRNSGNHTQCEKEMTAACNAILSAWIQAPFEPETALVAMWMLEQKKLLPDTVRLALHEWNVRCQPGIASVSTACARCAYTVYLQMLMRRDPAAAQYRKRFFAALKRALHNNPRATGLYGLLLNTKPSQEELTDVIQSSFLFYEMSARALRKNGNFEGALDVCMKMRRAAESEEENRAAKKARSLALELAIREQQGGQEEHCAMLWKALQAELRESSLDELERTKKWLEGGHVQKAAEIVNKACRNCNPVHPKLVLESARYAEKLADWSRIPFILVPFLTAPGETQTVEDITEAQRLLALAGDLSSQAHSRRVFLQHALPVMLAETTGEGDAAALQPHIAALEQLSRTAETAEESEWLQAHLIPLFAARGYIAMNQPQKAVPLLQKSLAICPNNGYALQLLGQYANDELTEDQRTLYEWLTQRKTPLAVYSAGLRWLNVRHTPLTLRPGQLVRSTDFLLIADREMNTGFRARLTFYNERGKKLFVAQQPRLRMDHSALTLRIGELVQMTSEERFVAGIDTLFPSCNVFLTFSLETFDKRPIQAWPDAPMIPAGNLLDK